MTKDNINEKNASNGSDIPALMAYTTRGRDLLRKRPQELNDYLKTCLFNAVIEIDADAVKAILEENLDFDVNSKDQYGRSAFAVAYLQKDLQATYQRTVEINDDESTTKQKEIISLLIERTDFSKPILEKSYVTPDHTVKHVIKKNILHLADHPDTPPSDLVYFLLKGADPEAHDENGKRAIDHYHKTFEYFKDGTTVSDRNAKNIHYQILSKDIAELFDPKNHLLLEKIIKDNSAETIRLKKHIAQTWQNIQKQLTSIEQQGQLFISC